MFAAAAQDCGVTKPICGQLTYSQLNGGHRSHVSASVSRKPHATGKDCYEKQQ